LIKAKEELNDIKIPEPIRYDERLDMVKTNPATNWGYDPKFTFKRKKIPVFPVNIEEINTLSRNKLKLEFEIGYLEKIKGIVNYFISDELKSRSKTISSKRNKKKYGLYTTVIKTVLTSIEFKKLKIQNRVTLNHKQLNDIFNIDKVLFPREILEFIVFVSRLKRKPFYYAKEQIHKRQIKKR
jgi:hypothetical protein